MISHPDAYKSDGDVHLQDPDGTLMQKCNYHHTNAPSQPLPQAAQQL